MATPMTARGSERGRRGGAASEELARIAAEAAARLEAWAAEESERRRGEFWQSLNQCVRRMRQAEGEADWGAALADGAALCAGRAAVAVVEGERLRVIAAVGMEGLRGAGGKLEGAWREAAGSGEPVIAARSSAEMGAELFGRIGGGAGKMVLAPVEAHGRVAAIVYAEAEAGDVETAGLEMLASVGGAMLDRRAARRRGGAGLIGIETGSRRWPRWEELPRQEQELHLRAQRKAKVQVARMRLYEDEAVQRGRRERDLYGCLRGEIEAGREEFDREFVKASPTMVDYFHLELLRELANDDEEMLGGEYPGPLV